MSTTQHLGLPRGPVLGWASFAGARGAALPAIDDAPAQQLTTSGRAALSLALQALQLPPRAKVLVPSYHCPTMIAPVLHAGLQPAFYALGEDALPRLDALPPAHDDARVLIVAHLFGLPRSLAAVRQWCDARGVALIEDCAHSYFGHAGERPVGAWGDFATASLTKFFPVPEAGLLVSATRALPALALAGQGWKAQLKGAVDVLELATQSGRLAGLQPALRGLFWLKNRRGAGRTSSHEPGPISAPAASDELQGCDMQRTHLAPLAVARWGHRQLPRARMAERRRANFQQLKAALLNAPGTRVMFQETATDAPYALPLWVDDAERVYQGLRAAGMPVFRWDRVWAGTPTLAHDEGAGWRRHVLQLLCHQDLSEAETAQIAFTLRRLL